MSGPCLQQTGGFNAGTRRHGEHAERAAVERVALPDVWWRPDDIGVVRHEQQERAVDVVAFGRGELDVERARSAVQEVRHDHLRRSSDSIVAVGILADQFRVHAERDVVQEDPVVHGRVVDPLLDAIAKHVHALTRVVVVEPEIERKVVACAGADAHEREAVLDHDRCNRRHRPVTARHPETVGSTHDGIPSEAFEIATAVEHDGLDAQLRGKLDDVEPHHLPAAR